MIRNYPRNRISKARRSQGTTANTVNAVLMTIKTFSPCLPIAIGMFAVALSRCFEVNPSRRVEFFQQQCILGFKTHVLNRGTIINNYNEGQDLWISSKS